MTLPVLKAKPIDQFISSTFDVDRVKVIKADLCSSCGKAALEFTSERSLNEYSISGLCQVCQNEFFD